MITVLSRHIAAPGSRSDEEKGYPTENALSALGKILKHFGNDIQNKQQVMQLFVTSLPFVYDAEEGVISHTYFVSLVEQYPFYFFN